MKTQQFSQRVKSSWLVITIFCLMSGVTLDSVAGVPDELEDIVFGDEKRPTIKTSLNDIPFEALATFSEYPYLLWPADSKQPKFFPDAVGGGREWLDRCAETLGYEGFKLKFRERAKWRENDTWIFDLVRNGLRIHGSRLEVHWDGRNFLGIVNHTPGKIIAIDGPPQMALGEEWVYYAEREGDRGFRMVPAKVVREIQGDKSLITIVTKDGDEVGRIMQQGLNFVPHDALRAVFEEFVLPAGTFPDQISVAEDGIVWISQPNNNLITNFDPISEEFTQYPVGDGGSGPDGLIVGTQGRVWSGMYYSGSLGLFETATETHHNYPAPYSSAAMAIPVETTDGNVWVTDHQRNRISEFDPVTETWLQSIIMPTSNCWVVQGHEDRDHGFVYYTEYNANKLGKIAVGGSTVIDIQTPGGGPAFCVYSEGKVYYSRWTESGIGAYDVKTGTIIEYQFPINNESGGPLWLTPDGKIVTGTRNRGYIMVFNPRSERIDAYQIPSANPGLKDGLTVGADGTIWFTESGLNKLGKLVLMPL